MLGNVSRVAFMPRSAMCKHSRAMLCGSVHGSPSKCRLALCPHRRAMRGNANKKPFRTGSYVVVGHNAMELPENHVPNRVLLVSAL